MMVTLQRKFLIVLGCKIHFYPHPPVTTAFYQGTPKVIAQLSEYNSWLITDLNYCHHLYNQIQVQSAILVDLYNQITSLTANWGWVTQKIMS